MTEISWAWRRRAKLRARAAAAAIHAEWKSDPQPSSKELFEYLKKNALPRDPDEPPPHETGSVATALASADHRLQQTYTVAYIAHAPLEPRAALAQWNGDRLTVWTGTQRPFGVRSELAAAFHIPEDHVRVLMPDMGSGYGGKHTGETAIEAARLARAAKRPVRVNWTREEEFTWAYFRPAGVIEISSGMSKDGTVTAWEFHNYNSGAAGIRTYYEIPNQKIEFHPTKSPLRQGSYRGLAATANHFAREIAHGRARPHRGNGPARISAAQFERRAAESGIYRRRAEIQLGPARKLAPCRDSGSRADATKGATSPLAWKFPRTGSRAK